MKRSILLLITVIAMTSANGQSIIDGLRYSQENTTGTARFNALSGAFGALGGDLSAIAINPAGGAVFLRNEASISAGVTDTDNESLYFGTLAKSLSSDVNLNQVGGVFVFDNVDENSNWKKFTLGINYNNTQNFENELFIAGTGNNSISNYFLEQAQGLPLNLLELQGSESISDLYNFLGENQGTRAQNAFLGYQGFIFDPVEPNNSNNTQYISNVAPGSFNQEYALVSEGYSGKYTLNLATQYTDDFFFGINLNSHIIDYKQSTYLAESNINQGSTIRNIGFENNLSVLGSGFSAQVGAIAKVANNLRLGLTYDTPTWFTISEETTQYLETQRTVNGQIRTAVIDPNVLNIYEDYDLKTPGKLAASAAYIFGQSGLISFDYSYKDYSEITFKPTSDPVFAAENSFIGNTLQGASTFRVGGEYRLSELSLRAGYRYEESPYSDKQIMDDLNGYSFGFGYSFGNYYVDASFVRTEQERQQQLYNIGLTDRALVNTVNNNFVFTFGLKL
ncbi:outer membrane protein transport protein [uncultured Marixanthomonas sp.]|uniref:OmpP1/FadL family transporter n=1 Tax=uncultured Marixanthomonas sp. TaxID=757245 RepID=UPI0030D74B2A|tara:strand:- start:5251 stop:6771 length:1521 start_codon:yes stop_codon:yes gene_type:complete